MGSVALAGAFMGVLADLFSAWTASANTMGTAISIDMSSIQGLFLDKSRWSFVLGTYLGVFFIPLHMFGFFLIYLALKPVGHIWALAFLVASIYVVALGAGFHGTLAFVADTVQSGDETLLIKIMAYWQVWGAVMITGYLAICAYLLVLILSGKTLYSRISAIFSPIPVLAASTVLIALLPDSAPGIKNFFAVTGLNLPLLIFYIVTLRTLLGRAGERARF